jgi:dTDP-4-amino-4,6-dideoxygalactose transaminase
VSRINVMKPWLGEEEIAAVSAAILSGWIAQGPRVAEFEKAFAEHQQAHRAVAVSSCTTALHLAMVVAGVGPGDEVVIPSFSFVATTNCVRYVGATPVFADVDATTGNLTAATVEPVLTARTKAVIGVDQGGVPLDLEPLRTLLDPRGIVLVEDAACAAGSTYRGRPVGAGAQVCTWSFHPRKILTTGEGGMLTTSRDDWSDQARRLREHAMSVSAAERHGSVLPPQETYDEVGFNFRMTDLQAAVGLVQLTRLDEVVSRRRELAARYAAAIASIPGLRAVADPEHGTSNFQSYWVEVLPGYGTDREGLLATLAAADISARRGIMAAHRQLPYRGLAREGSLPVTDRLTDNTLILPLYHELSEHDQDRVIDVLGGQG